MTTIISRYVCAYLIPPRKKNVLQVSTNGLIHFDDHFVSYVPCDFPCTQFPVIAPLWTDLTFAINGLIYYRIAEDLATLDQVSEMLSDFHLDFHPTLALIVTWFESSHYRSSSVRE